MTKIQNFRKFDSKKNFRNFRKNRTFSNFWKNGNFRKILTKIESYRKFDQNWNFSQICLNWNFSKFSKKSKFSLNLYTKSKFIKNFIKIEIFRNFRKKNRNFSRIWPKVQSHHRRGWGLCTAVKGNVLWQKIHILRPVMLVRRQFKRCLSISNTTLGPSGHGMKPPSSRLGTLYSH